MKVRELKTILDALDDETEIEMFHIPKKEFNELSAGKFVWKENE